MESILSAIKILGEEVAAPAISAYGVLSARREICFKETWIQNRLRHLLADEEIVRFVFDIPFAYQYAEMLARAWNTVAISPVRLEVLSTRKEWLIPLVDLLHKAPKVTSVWVRSDIPNVGISWNWPLRIGMLSDPRSKALASDLLDSQYRNLFHIVDAANIDLDYEVLLLPWNLRMSTGIVLSLPHKLRSDLALVLGGGKAATGQVERMARLLRDEIECSGLALGYIPKDKRRTWFDRWIREISHDKPLDVALSSAARELGIHTPLFFASESLISNARLSRFIDRLGNHLKVAMRSTRPPLDSADRSAARDERRIDLRGELDKWATQGRFEPTADDETALNRLIKTIRYDHEYDGATFAVELREASAKALGRPIRLAKAKGRGKESVSQDDKRCVQARIYEGDRIDPQKELSVLRPNAIHVVAVRIGDPSDDWPSADVPFPVHELEPSPEGYDLTIIFCELTTDSESMPAPNVGHIHLPAKGSSIPYAFVIKSGKSPGVYKARVIVLHRNRTLQSVMLQVPIAEGQPEQDEKLTLTVEARLVERLSGLEDRNNIDAAIILNHDGNGNPAALAASGDTVAFFKLEGMDNLVKEIHNILSGTTALPQMPGSVKPGLQKLNNQVTLDILRPLACHGQAMWTVFKSGAGNVLSGSVPRIQVLEARSGAFLPIEFFYTHKAPWKPETQACPKSDDALSGNCDQKSCEYDNDSTLCPIAFWGTSKIIEHQTRDVEGGKEFQLSRTEAGTERLEPLTSVLIGASSRVKEESLNMVKEAFAVGLNNPISFAKSWNDWGVIVKNNRPTLLVLMSHTAQGALGLQGMLSLEISGNYLPLVGIDETKVALDRSVKPVVLLFGCSTRLSEIAFEDFVEYFRNANAAIVIATLSPVQEKHMAKLIEQLILNLRAQQHTDTTFGMVLLDTRRKMLAEGDPFGMTLVAYGDADWLI
jgi:hypothetical protein